jgi:hypothetical protein
MLVQFLVLARLISVRATTIGGAGWNNGIIGRCSHTLIKVRALFIAVSAWTCLMKAFFNSSESEAVVEAAAEEDDRELPKKEGIMGLFTDVIGPTGIDRKET